MPLTGTWDHRKVSRRHLLRMGGLGAGALVLAGHGFTGEALAKPKFVGVASGDPLPDGVVLWTRLAPEPLAPDGSGGLPPESYKVRWEVSEDESFRRVVGKGKTEADPALGHSVHVEVGGLRPGREYFYRFEAGREISPVGRTKTAPPVDQPTGSMAFAVASCQAYQSGFYTAYRHMADEDVDLVVHLGDYIYEGGVDPNAVRQHDGPEPDTLAGYRKRHALYRSDADLQAAHAAFAWVVTFDDHEVDNNWAGEIPQDRVGPNATRESFLARRAAAFQAYYEHLPLRRSAIPQGPDILVYRRLTYGDLAEFSVLDTRQYRDDQDTARRLEPGRQMTGPAQEQFVLDGLARSRARWNILAQQVFFAERDFTLGAPESFSSDAWDGYVTARDRILGFVAERNVANPVVLTGDVHKHYAADLKADFEDDNSATIGTEFVATSISTGGDGQDISTGGQTVLAENPHIRFTNEQRGYLRCRLDQATWETDFRVLPFVRTPGAPISTRATYVTEAGNPGVQPA